ncbi:TPA: porin [Burkholderia vietnamiensis]|uniref:porin n=1 Tax=Burkholderia vietnamiensis TaxID=60552 RepID=UPI0009BDE004|nr:porin [Burkholderia vietnamiensis]MBR8016461.1 porin [Burkholderia vietnamiensis]HDR9045307.1 porin [Burkholderia vietnamiensis]HDR9198453.1 porin [Burkholderia vietnamiensis]
MKKKLLFISLACVSAAPAFAQSSGTLYGIIDAGLTYVNNTGGHSVFETQSGVAQGSRWGLRGAEDLGGGLKAIFTLENGFNTFNGGLGQGKRLFGRQAYVGLSSDQWGALTLGRQYDPVVDFVQPTTMNGSWGAYFSHAGDIDNTDNGFRVNNSVKYVSPSMAGLKFGALYAFGGAAGNFRQNSTISAGASYSNGNLYLGAAYFYARNPATQFDDGNFVANPTTPGVPVNAGAYGYVGNPYNMQVIGAGATYKIGAALLGVNYTNVKFDKALGTSQSAKFNNYELWGSYSLTPMLTVAIGDTYTRGNLGYSSDVPAYNQVNGVVDYALSKRTDVYLMAIYEKAFGGANAAIYNGFIGAPSSTPTQIATRIGIRHKF